ncbi:MAG: 30S ribosomal protein S8e [Candidatus Aenigmarchaeota archaeon]|nr:30S ribosomal protein S8e [Candidatus Aenigmarchaeota archaeon]
MGIWQTKSKRKSTGGLLHTSALKRKHATGSNQIKTIIGDLSVKVVRTKGGNAKAKVVSSSTVNLIDKKTGKAKKVKILDVLENKANPHFVRQKLLTKGAVVKTDAGKVKITSRPAQDGVVNGVVVE